jgi:hypothetical protein
MLGDIADLLGGCNLPLGEVADLLGNTEGERTGVAAGHLCSA